MRLTPLQACALPFRLEGWLKGFQAVIRPDACRAIAVIYSAQFKTWTIYLTQEDNDTILIEVEEGPPNYHDVKPS